MGKSGSIRININIFLDRSVRWRDRFPSKALPRTPPPHTGQVYYNNNSFQSEVMIIPTTVSTFYPRPYYFFLLPTAVIGRHYATVDTHNTLLRIYYMPAVGNTAVMHVTHDDNNKHSILRGRGWCWGRGDSVIIERIIIREKNPFVCAS